MEGSDHALSGQELIRCHVDKATFSFPVMGEKRNSCNNTWMENKQVESRRRSLHHAIAAPHVAQRSQISEAVWVVDKDKARVTKPTGKQWDVFGHVVDNEFHLSPEEALFMLESESIQITCDSVPMSLQQAYEAMLGKDCNLEEYLTFAHLTRLGYKVVRHQGDLGITKYVKDINLDKYQRKRKAKPNSNTANSPEKQSRLEGAHECVEVENESSATYDLPDPVPSTSKNVQEEIHVKETSSLSDDSSKNETLENDEIEDNEDDEIKILSDHEVALAKAVSLMPNCYCQSKVTLKSPPTDLLPFRAWPKEKSYMYEIKHNDLEVLEVAKPTLLENQASQETKLESNTAKNRNITGGEQRLDPDQFDLTITRTIWNGSQDQEPPQQGHQYLATRYYEQDWISFNTVNLHQGQAPSMASNPEPRERTLDVDMRDKLNRMRLAKMKETGQYHMTKFRKKEGWFKKIFDKRGKANWLQKNKGKGWKKVKKQTKNLRLTRRVVFNHDQEASSSVEDGNGERLDDDVEIIDEEATVDNEQVPEVLTSGPLKSLWLGQTWPLLLPRDALSSRIILNKIKLNQRLVNTVTKLKISYDLYLPTAKFQKSRPRAPTFRIVVCKGDSALPNNHDIKATVGRLRDELPLLFAVVTLNNIAFYNFFPVKLPTQEMIG